MPDSTDIVPDEALPETIYDRVSGAIRALNSDHATEDDALSALTFIARLKELTKQLNQQVEDGVIAFIQAHGDIEMGTVRWYVGPNKSTKCVNVKGAVEALMNATGGDFDAFCECLASGALKHGACSKVLSPETYNSLFETKEVTDLKTGVAKGAKLQKIDKRFLK